MAPAEPDLFQYLPWSCRTRPKRRRKLLSPLIDGESLIGVQNVWMKTSVKETIQDRSDAAEQGRYSERSDRVPNPNHRKFCVVHAVSAQGCEKCCALVLIPVCLKGRVYQVGIEVLCRQAANCDHACQAARSVCAPAKPEEKYLVFGIIGLGYFCVTVFDLLE